MKHFYTASSKLCSTFFIVLITLFLAGNLHSQGWNTGPGGNDLRNGFSSYAGPLEPVVLWEGSLTSVLAQQSVCDGNYLAMARTFNISDPLYGTKIVVHHLQTGDTLWTTSLPVDFPSTDWRNRVSAINNGVVYCTRAGNNNESYLYALDADDGAMAWKSDDVIDEGSTEGLVFAPNGDPIVGSMWYITRFSREDGSTVWKTDRLSYDDGGGVIVANGKVYSIKNLINNVGVAVYDLETGLELYTSAQLSGGLVNQLGLFAGSGGRIYLPRCQNNPATDSIFALKDDGTMLRRDWAVPIYYTPFATHGIGPDESVYAYNRNGEIMRLDPENGEVLNTSKVVLYGDATSPRMAIDAAGNIFVTNGGFSDGMFYSFNPDLTLRWEEQFVNINVGGPAIGENGTLVVTGKGTQVKAYLGEGLPETDFTMVTEGDIVNDGGWNYAMVWADFNNDELADLFVANNDGDNGKLNFLYLNNGDGTFEKITDGPVVTDGGSSYAATAADFNQDHNIDLFVANHNENNFLYLGNGDGTFQKVTQGIVVNDGGKSVGCAATDFDMDGYPDLFVANRDQKNFLYHGSGNPTNFTKVTNGSIVNDIANSSGCAWGDYNNDGYADLYVANSGSASCLYRNDYNEFTKVEEAPFNTDVSSCSGASWGDVDNDGDLDLFVSTGQLGMYNNWFYLNNGDGTFTKVTDSPLVNEATWSSGSAWGDYDKDGDIDLAVGGYDGDNLLFKNDGAGNFEKVTDNEFVNDGSYTEGLAWADVDNDGDLDIFTAKNNYFGGNNSFFLNNGNANNWLKVFVRYCGECIWGYGALGAKVYVYASINGEPVMQMRELNAQSGGGQGGQSEHIQFFGLADAAVVDSVVVNWMSSTFVEENVAVNQTLTLDLFTSIAEIEHDNILSAYPNPASDQITFRVANPNHEKTILTIFNLQGQKVATLTTRETELTWNLKGLSGKKLPAGIYTCRVVVANKPGIVKFVAE
jgi:outer membrane protein assembly factor BamB